MSNKRPSDAPPRMSQVEQEEPRLAPEKKMPRKSYYHRGSMAIPKADDFKGGKWD